MHWRRAAWRARGPRPATASGGLRPHPIPSPKVADGSLGNESLLGGCRRAKILLDDWVALWRVPEVEGVFMGKKPVLLSAFALLAACPCDRARCTTTEAEVGEAEVSVRFGQMVDDHTFQEPSASVSIENFAAHGGRWVCDEGVLHAPGGPGPKLICDEPAFSAGEVGVELLFPDRAAGNAGFIVKVSDCGVGADRFKGYELALDVAGHLVVGRHRQNFESIRNVPCPVPIKRWISLVVRTGENTLEVDVEGKTVFRWEDRDHPLATGQVGLRTWRREARYRNLWIRTDGRRRPIPFKTRSAHDEVSGRWRAVRRGSARGRFSTTGEILASERAKGKPLVHFYWLLRTPTAVNQPLWTGSHASRLREYIDTDHCGEMIPLEDRQRVYVWIDANVPYYGTYAHSHPRSPGRRDRFTDASTGREHAWFARDFMGVYNRRCAGCHGGFPHPNDHDNIWDGRIAWINLSTPDLSPALTAHLAKKAGGRGITEPRNGKTPPLFRSRSDPEFLTMLKAIEGGKTLMLAHPEADMPGFQFARQEP